MGTKRAGTIGIIAGMAAAFMTGWATQYRKTLYERNLSIKNYKINCLMSSWLSLRQQGRNLAEFFEQHHYKTIAIQGFGDLGRKLLDELSDTKIQVLYGIDRNPAVAASIHIPVVRVEDELEDVDAVIVTAVMDYKTIAEELYAKLDCPIISIEVVLNDLCE